LSKEIVIILQELNDKKDILLKRNEKISADGKGPIYICTRNNDLEEIIESTPSSRREDLVFLQNGMLDPYLKSKGLSDNTQALIYFAVAKKGDQPIDGKTDINPEGLTAVTGRWASDFSERLQKGDLACKVLNKNDWYVSMVSKCLWSVISEMHVVMYLISFRNALLIERRTNPVYSIYLFVVFA